MCQNQSKVTRNKSKSNNHSVNELNPNSDLAPFQNPTKPSHIRKTNKSKLIHLKTKKQYESS